MNFNFFLLLNELYFSFSILILLVYFVMYTISKKYKYVLSYKQFIGFSILVISFSSLLLINYSFETQYYFYYLLKNNEFINYIKLYINILLFFVLLNSFIYVKLNKFNNFEQYILILAIQLGLFFLIQSNNITVLYLSLELVSISIYLLIAFNKLNIYSIEIGLKYFILGAISSNVILFGLSLLYGLTGLTNINDYFYFFFELNSSLNISNYLNIFIHFSFILIIIGFFFKLYIAPFHLWISDIYQGTATHITSYIGIIPSICIYITLIYFLDLYNLYNNYVVKILLLFFSLFNILFGTIGALYQKKMKRLMAYSTITYNGYFLLCITIYISYNSIIGFYNFVLFYFFYLLILVPFFNVIMMLSKRLNKYITNNIDNIAELKQLFVVNSLLLFILTIVIFNFAGIPPFFNFLNKLILLFNLLKMNSNIAILLFIIAMTVISCYYYLRLVKIIYFNYSPTLTILNNKLFTNNYVNICFLFILVSYIFFYNEINVAIYYLIFNYL